MRRRLVPHFLALTLVASGGGVRAYQSGQPDAIQVTSLAGCAVTGTAFIGFNGPVDTLVVGTTCGLYKITNLHSDTPTVYATLVTGEIYGIMAGDFRGLGSNVLDVAWLELDPSTGAWTRGFGDFEQMAGNYTIFGADPVTDLSGPGWIVAAAGAESFASNGGQDYIVAAAKPSTGEGVLLFDDGIVGSGFVGPPKSQIISSDVVYVVAYDGNNDGQDDGIVLAEAGTSDRLEVLPYQGGAGDPFGAVIQTIGVADEPSSLAAGRFDVSVLGEGIIIGHSSLPGTLEGLRPATGPLPFETAPVDLGWPVPEVQPLLVLALDYNLDTFLDVVVVGDGVGTVLQGDGTSFLYSPLRRPSTPMGPAFQQWFGAPHVPPIFQLSPITNGQGEFAASWSQYVLVYTNGGNSYNLGENFIVGPGPDPSAPARFWVMSVEGAIFADITAYSATYGVNVASGNIRGPHPQTGGVGEAALTGPGPSPVFGPHVRAFDIVNNAAIAKINFFGYGTLKFGVRPGAGDLDGDGFDEILTGPGPGAVFGPHVRGWNFDNASLSAVAKVSFYAYNTLKWGVNVAGGNLDNETTYDEMATAPGPGAVFGPHVRGWNYDGTVVTAMAGLNTMAFPNGQYGANVACGDVDDSSTFPGREEVVVGRGPDPANGLSEATAVGLGNVRVTPIFTAYAGYYGTAVGAGNTDNQGAAEIIASPDRDPSASAQVKIFKGDGSVTPQQFTTFGTSYGARTGAIQPF